MGAEDRVAAYERPGSASPPLVELYRGHIEIGVRQILVTSD